MDKDISKSKNGKQNDRSPKDKQFDPSIDMLVNDFDDERTLEEEEALAQAEDPEVELSSLQKESNMPLEELLALYGYCSENKENSGSVEEAREETSSLEALEPADESLPSPEEPSKLRILYEPIPDNDQDTKRSRCVSQVSEEDDCDYNPEEDELRKTIMVGNDYQVQVPLGVIHEELAYEHEDKLLWNPALIESSRIEKYLEEVYAIKKPPLPVGTQLRDDEQALYLLHKCGYNTDEALRQLTVTVQATPLGAASESL